MSNISYGIITAGTLLESAGTLFQEHYEEVAKNKDVMKLKPHMEMYNALLSNDSVFIVGAADGEDLIGYSVNFIQPHLHYADLIYCQNDLLFITKEFRNSKAGLKLIKLTEEYAKRQGAQLMLWHAKQDTALDKLMPRLGCKVQDIIYSKEL